ncbi:MAG: hypothetical protein C0392_12055 [Syntrophus sp. (in: bacteria)]|nr:hypothetical protein [Syntrophus sp. (in: bacteria)]
MDSDVSMVSQGDVFIRVSLIDRSLYYKDLMLLIRKYREIHDEGKGMIMHIGEMLGFESKFCENTIKEVLDNNYIVDSPPHFEEPSFTARGEGLGDSLELMRFKWE